MAYSTQRVTSDGSLVLLDLSLEYFDRSEIAVLFDGVLSAVGWAWVGSTEHKLSFTPAVPNGVEVTVLRSTDIASVRHNYSGGAAFTYQTIDENMLQVLHIAQEARENAKLEDIFSDLNVHGYGIHNIANGVAMGDAVNVGQLAIHDSTILGYVAQCAASALAAANSAIAAASSALGVLGQLAASTGASLIGFIQSGTGSVSRTAQDKLRETVSVKDFGALVDGLQDDSSAVALAVAAVDSGGVIRVPNGALKLDADVSAPGKFFLIDADMTGAGSIIGDGVIVHQTNGTYKNTLTSFGVGFVSQDVSFGDSTSTHANSQATKAIVRKATGSGGNGPDLADMALLIGSEKKDYLTSAVRGEIDGIVMCIKQGQKDDVAGLLIDLEKVGGDTGGALAFESSNKRVDSAGTINLHIQSAQNFIEGAGGFSGTSGYGFWTEAQVGAAFSAFHANNVAPGGFTNFITLGSSRLPASLVYKVDGNGKTYAPSAGAGFPSYSFVSDPNTGMYNLGADQLGFSVGGTVRTYIDSTGALTPGADNLYSCGQGAGRWTVVYAATGAINTSDARDKQDVAELEGAEIRVAHALKGLIRKFRFKDAVAEKGDKARIHVGVIAQDVKSVFEAEGLDAFDYALLCWDEWAETQEERDEEGNVVTPYRAAGNRYGVRYDELLAFVISAL